MNLPNFNQHPTLAIAVIVQPSQAKSTNQTYKNISIAGIIVTLVITGITLCSLIRYRKCQNERQKKVLELIKDIPCANRIYQDKTNSEDNLIIQRKQQIETLEKIWNQTP